MMKEMHFEVAHLHKDQLDNDTWKLQNNERLAFKVKSIINVGKHFDYVREILFTLCNALLSCITSVSVSPETI